MNWRNWTWKGWTLASIGALFLAFIALGAVLDITGYEPPQKADERPAESNAPRQPSDAAPQQEEPSAPERPEPSAVSRAEVRSLEKAMGDYFRTYREGRYAEALRQVSDELIEECGGPTAYAFALSQLHRTEGVEYELVEVTKVRPENGDVRADVVTQEIIDGDRARATYGQSFTQERGRWVMTEDWSPGVSVFCE